MKLDKIIIFLLILGLCPIVFQSCIDDDCSDTFCDCDDECDGILHFTFDTESPLAFKMHEIDTIVISRKHKSGTVTADSIELHWVSDHYEATDRSPLKEFNDQCRQRTEPGFTIGFLTPFPPAVYDLYDYDVIVPGIRTFELRLINETGYFGEDCCKCYYSSMRTVTVDGREYTAYYYFDIFLSKN